MDACLQQLIEKWRRDADAEDKRLSQYCYGGELDGDMLDSDIELGFKRTAVRRQCADELEAQLAALRGVGRQSLRSRMEQEIAQQEAYAAQPPSPAWPNITPEYHRGIAAVLRLILAADEAGVGGSVLSQESFEKQDLLLAVEQVVNAFMKWEATTEAALDEPTLAALYYLVESYRELSAVLPAGARPARTDEDEKR